MATCDSRDLVLLLWPTVLPTISLFWSTNYFQQHHIIGKIKNKNKNREITCLTGTEINITSSIKCRGQSAQVIMRHHACNPPLISYVLVPTLATMWPLEPQMCECSRTMNISIKIPRSAKWLHPSFQPSGPTLLPPKKLAKPASLCSAYFVLFAIG